MQGIQQMNAGRGGKFHQSYRRYQNTRYGNTNREWQLSQIIEDWEHQQEAKKREEAIKEKARERKEFTKDLAKIIKCDGRKKKKRESTSSESSMSKDEQTSCSTSPETSPDQGHRKKRQKERKHRPKARRTKHKDEIDTEEITKSLIDL